MSGSVTRWLEQLGLGQYAGAFEENAIELEHLPDLNHDTLKEIGIRAVGHRMTVLKAAVNLNAAPEPEGRADAGAARDADSALTPSSASDAERRQLTVMFCDLAGSTELSQKLDPEDLQEVTRAYQDSCKAVIERYDGYVARYMGDGVLAYFGYPRAHEDDTERAIRAGLDVVESMAKLNEAVGDKMEIALRVRIGIATGAVVVGEIVGEGASQENTVIGETPNLAARLQALAGLDTVVVAPRTRELAAGRFEYEDLGPHAIKGIAGPVHAWKVISPRTTETRFEAAHPAGVTSLVGREYEIGILLELWEQARDGDGQVVVLSGEAGIGKSRIVETVRQRTAGDSVSLRYQCSPYHTKSTLHPVIDQLTRAARFHARDSDVHRLDKLESLLAQSAADIEAEMPLFAQLLSIPTTNRYPPTEMTADRQMDAVLEALLAQLRGLCREHSVIEIFEDAHWSDPTSLELFNLVAEHAESLPLLLVITTREHFSPPWIDQRNATSLSLNRFTRTSAATLMSRVTGGIPLPKEVQEKIIEKTDGVPLFIEELTKTILESGMLREEEDRYVLSGPLTATTIPATLHDSLMARLDRLASAKEVAQTAAAIGREFSFELLASIYNQDVSELEARLNELVEAGLMFRRSAQSNRRYLFKHALVRDAAYESLLHRKRADIHARIAESMESMLPEVGTSQPELLAHHWSQAGQQWKASYYWLEAGRRANEQSASVEAESHLRRGLESLLNVEHSRERDARELEFQLALGNSLMALFGYGSEKVAVVYQRALELCDDLDDTDRRNLVRYGLWANFFSRSKLGPSLKLSTEIIDQAKASDDIESRITGHRLQALTLITMGQVEPAMPHLDVAIDLYDPTCHSHLAHVYSQDPRVATLACQTWALWHLGYPDRSLQAARLSVQYAEELEHAHSMAYAYTWGLSRAHLLRREPEMALQFADRGIEVSTEYRFPLHRAQALLSRAVANSMLGETEAALDSVEAANKDYEATGGRLQRVWFKALCGEVYLGAGRLSDAGIALDEAQQAADETAAYWWTPELWRLRGVLTALRDSSNTDEAERCTRRAYELSVGQKGKLPALRAAMSLTALSGCTQERDEALQRLAESLGCIEEGESLADVQEAKVILASVE